MKKLKYVLALGSLLLIVPIVAKESLFNYNMDAASSTTPSFNAGDKVYIGKMMFTTLETIDGIKLLADQPTTASGSGITWADAQDSLDNLEDDFGTLGSSLLADNTTQPTKANLASFSIPDPDTSSIPDATMLNDTIPTFPNDWWLGDEAVNYKASFASLDNKFNSPINRTVTNFNSDNSCGTKEIIEYGVKQSENKQDEEIKKRVNADLTTINAEVSDLEGFLFSPKNFAYFSFKALLGYECSQDRGVLAWAQLIPWYEGITLKSPLSIGVDKNGAIICYNGICNSSKGYDHSPLTMYYIMNDGKIDDTIGKVTPVKVEKDVCINDANNRSGVDKGIAGNGIYHDYKSYMSEQDVSYNVTITGIKYQGGTEKACPGQPQTAGTSSVRPYVSLPSPMVLLGNQSKRSYIKGNSMQSNVPSSDGKQYLTLEAPSLGIGLTPNASGVNGSTLSTSIDSNNILQIPVTLSGESEGDVYVSAMAQDAGSNPVYGVLEKMDDTSGIVSLDISNLVQDPKTAKEVKITLYQENSGEFNTSYMGQGTDITIKILDAQTIAFDEGQADKATYGSDIVLTSHITSDINKQSDQAITYSIITPEGDTAKASIENQSYDSTSGKATAAIKTTTGVGSIQVAINKAGNASAGAAPQVIKEIQLEKKKVDVSPAKPTKVYTVGETMPAFTNVSTGLVSADTLPEVIKPTLSPLSADDPTTPDSGGTITSIGTWKMLYPANILDGLTEFTNKYDVTLKDYDDDPSFVFETGITDIPAGWIDVSPQANEAGWNKETVTLSPNQEAKDAGYTVIEVLNASNQVDKRGETISYPSETIASGITVRVRLKRGTSTSTASSIGPIKIDLTKPTLSVSIENETTWTKVGKLVTITTSDALSGIRSVTAEIDGTTYTPIKGSDNNYTFTADKNGKCIVKVQDIAGHETTIEKDISKIDPGKVTLTAVPQDNSADKIKQDISITRDPSTSGIKTFKVYYKSGTNDAYQEIDDLDQTRESFTYVAQMNGHYKFELVNNAGSSEMVEISLTGITPPTPVTKIEAVWKDDTSKTYENNTWTNHDIVLKLSNINEEITDDVTWVASDEVGNEIIVNADGEYLVETTSLLNKTYSFTAKSSLGVDETVTKKITVKIDKTLPPVPVIKDVEKYGENKWFLDDVTVETNELENRPSGIGQKVYYQVNGTGNWNEAVGGKYTFTDNGKYQIAFKTIDEAGNESLPCAPAYVNINSEKPNIVIKLNTNPIKELINDITFGIFFKDTIDVDFEVDYGIGGSGEVFYIIEDIDDSSMPKDESSIPEDDDPRWDKNKGTSTTINPEAKVMIYVKVVSDTGVIVKEYSENYVVADAEKPFVELPDETGWTKEDSLE